jgi:hypothetical protein
MALQITIAGTPVTFLEDSFQLHLKIDERQRCQFTVIDYTGTQFYSRGMQVVVTDPVLGRLYQGYVINDKQDKSNVYPDPTVEHQIDTIDNIYLAAKRTSKLTYTNPTLAGKIAVDMVRSVLGAEGVVANYAVDENQTQADFAEGTLTNVVSTLNIGDGDLELLSSSSVSQTYNTQAQWQIGTFTNTQANSGGDLSLIGFTRNWDDGNKSNQTLFGQGSPTDSINSGNQYALTCTAGKETRSRLDFAGTWLNGTMECDVVLGADTPKHSLSWRTTTWSNNDSTYAYVVELTTSQIELRKGSNSSSGSSSSLALTTFATKLAAGSYRLRVVFNGSSHTAYVNGVQQVTATDATWSTAGMLTLRNRNGTSATLTQKFDNFGVMSSLSGTWQGPSTSISSIAAIASSVIKWDTSLSTGGTVLVQTSIDGGSTFQTCSNGGTIPGLTNGSSGAGKSVIVKATLSNTTTATMPDIRNLTWNVIGGYVSSGSRSTAPIGNDTMVRADQAGIGTAFDGQTYTKVGTATDAISSNEATITNTTGDVFEVLGSTTAGDQDATVRIKLSASTMTAGLAMRYVDVNNHYRFSASTTTLTITKVSAGVSFSFPTVAQATTVGTFYYMRFRVTGDGAAAAISLQGKVWQAGTLEPPAWSITASD